jgi:uncharacterized protein YjbJ (UPF0337 family)
MDSDRVKGAVKTKVGEAKEVAGKALGDEKLRQEGNTEKNVGKVQNTLGGLKDAIRGK